MTLSSLGSSGIMRLVSTEEVLEALSLATRWGLRLDLARVLSMDSVGEVSSAVAREEWS